MTTGNCVTHSALIPQISVQMGDAKITQRSEDKHISLGGKLIREKARETVFCWIACKHKWGDIHSEAGTLISFYRHTPWTGDGLVADPQSPNLYSVVYCT